MHGQTTDRQNEITTSAKMQTSNEAYIEVALDIKESRSDMRLLSLLAVADTVKWTLAMQVPSMLLSSKMEMRMHQQKNNFSLSLNESLTESFQENFRKMMGINPTIITGSQQSQSASQTKEKHTDRDRPAWIYISES